MKSYIITNPSGAVKDKLTQADIEWQEWEDNDILIALEAKQIAHLLGAVSYQTSNTEWEEIYTITFVFPTQKPAKTPVEPVAINPKHRVSRENYIKLTGARLEEVLKVSRNAFEKSLAALWPAIGAYLEKARIAQAHKLKENPQAMHQHFKEEYRRLMSLPQVKAVRYIQGQLLVYTNTLIATGGNTSTYHQLGEFLIVLTPEDKEGKFLHCYNLTRQVNAAYEGMHAPYVYPSGRPCPSEVLESLVELVALMEYATTTELFLQFLENVQDDTMGDYLPLWPELQPE
jgi:hypothetical protein